MAARTRVLLRKACLLAILLAAGVRARASGAGGATPAPTTTRRTTRVVSSASSRRRGGAAAAFVAFDVAPRATKAAARPTPASVLPRPLVLNREEPPTLRERRRFRLSMAAASGDDNNESSNEGKSKSNGNPLDFIFNPYESKIPKEVEADIYRAEANTPAAQNRASRIALYVSIAVVGVLAAFFNAFLTELRSPDGLQADMEEFDLASSAFAWVLGSGITQFLFLNKIGGGIMLLVGAGSGLLAEAEWDSRRINAERIWEELQRRRSESERKSSKKKAKSASTQATAGGGRSSMSKKKAKRLSALSEVVMADEPAANSSIKAAAPPVGIPAVPSEPADSKDEGSATDSEAGGGLGILKGIKDMYDKADAMAASQALLLNKQLEDAGVLEKITDETGLKVVERKQGAAAASAAATATGAGESVAQGGVPAPAEKTSGQNDE